MGGSRVRISDINGDSIFDVIASRGRDLVVHLGIGEREFARQGTYHSGGSEFTIADVNRDNLPDVVTLGWGYWADLDVLQAIPPSTTTTATQLFAYDSTYSQVTSYVDELGRRTIYTIDPLNGNRLSETRIVGNVDNQTNGETDDVTVRYTYTSHVLVDRVTDPLGRITDYDYDLLGRLTRVTYAVGLPEQAINQFGYDLAGNLTFSIDANGNRSEFVYDAMNRMTKLTQADPDGPGPLLSPVTNFEYDRSGNLISYIDANGSKTTSSFDAMNRMSASTGADPDGAGPLSSPVTGYFYDQLGNLVKLIDPNGNATTYVYDGRGRRIQSKDADGGITKFGYDTDGNLIRLTDPVGNTTIFKYDSRNRLIEEVDPLGHSTFYEYDLADNLREKTDRNGRVTRYSYDDLDRMVKEEWLGSADEVLNTIAYSYDKSGNLLVASDKDSKLTYTYDALDRAIVVDNTGTPNAPAAILEYTYDGNGNVLSVEDTINSIAGATTSYAYDSLNRLVRLSQTGNEVSEKRVDFAYNSLGQYKSIDRYKDLLGTQLVIGTDYSYDQLNRLKRIDHKNAADVSVAFFDYEYDTGSRITRITDIGNSTDYEYDKRDQLIKAEHADAAFADEFYSYDANGNRISSHLHGTGYVTGKGNRLFQTDL